MNYRILLWGIILGSVPSVFAQTVIKNSSGVEWFRANAAREIVITNLAKTTGHDTALILADQNGQLIRVSSLNALSKFQFFKPEKRHLGSFDYLSADSSRIVNLGAVPAGAQHALLRGEVQVALKDFTSAGDASKSSTVTLYWGLPPASGLPAGDSQLEIEQNQAVYLQTNLTVANHGIRVWVENLCNQPGADAWLPNSSNDAYGALQMIETAAGVVPLQRSDDQGQFAFATHLEGTTNKSDLQSLTVDLWLEGYYISMDSLLRE